MALSGARTKREAVDMGLRMLVQVKRQGELRKLWGLGWKGDLEEMRRD
jgi:Arc/MetJ family transcription regulator